MGIITGIRDRVADRVLDYSYSDNAGTACRSFVNTVIHFRGNRDSLIGTNPEDFDLIKICDVDSHGVISDARVILLMSGASVPMYFEEFDRNDYFDSPVFEDDAPFQTADLDGE